jgi:hypothetical protein
MKTLQQVINDIHPYAKIFQNARHIWNQHATLDLFLKIHNCTNHNRKW